MTWFQKFFQHPHAWHHIEFWGVVLLFVLLLYKPPRGLQESGIREFIEHHFGDSIGLYLLHLGITLVIVGAIWNLSAVGELGQSIVLMATGILKLTKAPPSETNENQNENKTKFVRAS